MFPISIGGGGRGSVYEGWAILGSSSTHFSAATADSYGLSVPFFFLHLIDVNVEKLHTELCFYVLFRPSFDTHT